MTDEEFAMQSAANKWNAQPELAEPSNLPWYFRQYLREEDRFTDWQSCSDEFQEANRNDMSYLFTVA